MTNGPDFLIIGSPKAGTTYLYDLLAQHPGVFLSEDKEPSFFSLPDRWALGWDWYLDLFEQARPDQVKGEASTHYADGRHIRTALPRIKERLPHVKMIYIVRHPIDRLFSHYRFFLLEVAAAKARYLEGTRPFPKDYRYYFDEKLFHMKNFTQPGVDFTPSFEEFTRIFDAAFLDTSRYYSYVQIILSLFPRDQLLVLLAEDLFSDAQATLDEVCEFLGIEPRSIDIARKSNDYESVFRTLAQGEVRKKVLDQPFLSGAARRFVPQWGKKAFWHLWDALPRNKAGMISHSALDANARQKLVALYEDENMALGRFLDRDLSHWNS